MAQTACPSEPVHREHENSPRSGEPLSPLPLSGRLYSHRTPTSAPLLPSRRPQKAEHPLGCSGTSLGVLSGCGRWEAYNASSTRDKRETGVRFSFCKEDNRT